MSVFVTTDIHGEYDMFIELLNKINLSDDDTLYILGDYVDRGPEPIKVIQKIMSMSNVVCLIGNHDCMCYRVLRYFDTDMEKLSEEKKVNFALDSMDWLNNDGEITRTKFKELDIDEKYDILDFLCELSAYEKIGVNGQRYILKLQPYIRH